MRRLLLLVFALSVWSAAAGDAAVQSADELFVHAAGSGGLQTQDARRSGAGAAAVSDWPREITSRTEVGLRLDRLFDGPGGVAQRIILNVGPHTWTATFVRLDTAPSGFRSWVGILHGVPESHVVFTERGGVVSGLIDALGVAYQLRTARDGVHVLERVDRSLLPDEPEPLFGLDGGAVSATGATPGDEASTIDIMLLYTAAARAQRGGTAQIEALAAQIASDTNTAFARSGVAARVRLVAARELPYAEAPQMSLDLPLLRDHQQARAWRDAAGADLVQLLVSSPDRTACGVGYLLSSFASSNFDAYSVADVACAAQYTPTHEMGHNLGSHHAPEDGASGALFSYSYGYKDPARGFRTIMAYGCPGTPCQRVLNFSNPHIVQNGAPAGSPSQNNARSIAEAAAFVANFRPAAGVVPPGATPPSTPTNLRSNVNGATVTVAWDPSPSGTSAPTSYVLQAGTGPALSDVFNASVGLTTSASGTLPPGAYFWRVIAVNAAGQSAASPDAHFVIGCALPTAPANFSFGIAGRHVTLTWTAVAGTPVVSYVVEAGSAPALANLLVAPVGAQTTVATAAPPGTYYVRVRAQNACGTSGPSNEQVIVVP